MEQTNTVLESIQKNLSLIASQAGVVLEHLWIILTKQQVLIGLQQFLIGLMGIGFGLFLSYWIGKIKKSGMAVVDKRFVMALGFVVMLIVIFWGASVIVDSLPRLFNPEYYSIKEAVDMLQKVRK